MQAVIEAAAFMNRVKPKTNQTIIRPPATAPKTGADGKPYDFQLSYALDMLHGKVASLPMPAAN